MSDWKNGAWNKAEDGSAMKVSEAYGVIKSERISNTERPHEHQIVKVDRMTGQVKEIYRGENSSKSEKENSGSKDSKKK